MDSVCLLLLIYGHFNRDHEIVVLHYNHNTRGPETDADELFVTAMANSLGLRIFSEKRKKSMASSEEVLRRDRYDFFLKVMHSIGCDCLILGHHLDDMIESMIMRLAKGCGGKALASPLALQQFRDHTRVRPMLNIKRSSIEQSLKTAEIPWREDLSNHSDKYLRNRLRCCIQRDFDTLFRSRDWRNGFALARRLLAEDSEALDQIAATTQVSPKSGELDLAKIRSMPRAVIRRVIASWLETNNLVNMITHRHLSDIVDCIIKGSEKTLSCTTTRVMVIKNDRLIITQVGRPEVYSEFNFGNWIQGDLNLPSGLLGRREISGAMVRKLSGDDGSLARLALAADAKLMVRNWRPGDAYIPFGLGGYKKLKKCFCERKIPLNMRKILPVITNENGEILWVPGLSISNSFRIKYEDKLALELTFSRR
jgi:tRNA(Ile)-lysidine synthase